VVSEGEDVSARREQPVRQTGRDAGAVRDVFCVDDAEARAVLLLQAGQALLDRGTAGLAEDVGYEKDDYGNDSAAAGWTETEAWLPASGV
jgi:hypothetical protein